MNVTFPHLLSQGDLSSDCHSLLWQTCDSPDVGYHSTSGSLSPASSTDSGCFSPPGLQWGAGPEASVCSVTSYIIQDKKPSPTSEKSSRSRYPGKKRQSASEREKLRMRNLSKALHHLRTYLPPSVAPAGQTLTKIETLRLTIHYISHLTEQLGLSEEIPSQGSRSHMSSSLALHWDETQYLPQDGAAISPQHSLSPSTDRFASRLLTYQNTNGMSRHTLSKENRVPDKHNFSFGLF